MDNEKAGAAAVSGGRTKIKFIVRHDFGMIPFGGLRTIYADEIKTAEQLLEHIRYFLKFPRPLFIEIEVMEAGGLLMRGCPDGTGEGLD